MRAATAASSSKQHIRRLSQIVSYHISRILKAYDLIKGTVCIQKKKCGNPRCKCARGELHQAKVISFSHEGKTRLIPLTKYSYIDIMRIERQVRNYQLFRLNRAKAVQVFKELISAFNTLEQHLLIEVPSYPGEELHEHERRGSRNKKSD